jgi:hypothetical protein
MAIILYLLGAVLMAELLMDDNEERTPVISLIISSLVWPLQALVLLWEGLFPKQPED